MSTVAKPQPASNPAPVRPITSSFNKPGKSTQLQHEQNFLFGKENYIWMAAGVALIFIGFMLMSGGKSPDPHQFNYDEIFSFRRITLAPVVILTGFVVEVFAIMRKPKEEATTGGSAE